MMIWRTFALLSAILHLSALAWTPIVVSNVTLLGTQQSPDVTNVSRDGGYSVLLNGNIVYLYDDTECMDEEGNQLSFVSNTAAYVSHPNTNIAAVTDFGVVNLGVDKDGAPKNAILADTSVETGGWIPFETDELNFNEQKKGTERVAIWPGTNPTTLTPTSAFLFSPLVYVDPTPQDPSKEYQQRGMTLISITAPPSGPVATRQGDLIIPGTEVGYGGFSTVVGRPSSSTTSSTPSDTTLDVYLLGMTGSGLQLARVDINDLTTFAKYTFWSPRNRTFVSTPPDLELTDPAQIYLPGTYSSGSVFYSPYFQTFLMVYFNKLADSTFYIRYLDISQPVSAPTNDSDVWVANGKNGSGIEAEDVEALVKYPWSEEQTLYAPPPGRGGFNYAGMPHPEYFNRHYYPSTQARSNPLFIPPLPTSVPPPTTDGQTLLLSWTSQLAGGGVANGVYSIELAVVSFGGVPGNWSGVVGGEAGGSGGGGGGSVGGGVGGEGGKGTGAEGGEGESVAQAVGRVLRIVEGISAAEGVGVDWLTMMGWVLVGGWMAVGW